METTITTVVLEKCLDNRHLKSPELYCKSCNVNVCLKCLSTHNHSVHTVDDIFDEIMNESKKGSSIEINKSIEHKTKEKELNIEKFNNDIKAHYDQQIELITQHFRKLHDSLHIKEIELKRELKSYQVENEEQLTKVVSKLDHDIDESNNFLSKLIDKNKDLSQIDLQDKSSFIKYYLKNQNLFQNINNNNGTIDKNQNGFKLIGNYQTYSFKEIELNDKLIQSMTLFRRGLLSKFKNSMVVFTDTGLDIFSLNNGDMALTRKSMQINKNISPFTTDGSFNTYYMYQDASILDKTFIFFKNKYWIITLLDDGENVNIEVKPSPIPFSALSTIYDGRDCIFLFGGFDEVTNSHVTTIYQFNIYSGKFELVGNLNVAGCVFNLSRFNDKIHISGGFGKPHGAIPRIDLFDINNHTISPLCNLIDCGLKCTSTITSCFVPKTNRFYILDDTSIFTLDIDTKIVNEIGDINALNAVNQNHKSKFYYDGDNTIYFFSCGNSQLFSYKIDENDYGIISFLDTNILQSNYYSFINDNN